jgi:hypothetical protein
VARAQTIPGPLDTLEEAFDLLQRASASAWLRYLTGVAPLIVGLLYAWNEFSSARAASENPVAAALMLVVLLVWFYRCRQIFAGHLRTILGIASTDDASPRIRWTLAAFEGTKLVAIPVAFLSIIPLAYTTAYYRTLTLFAGEGRPSREAASKAWKCARMWQRENWFVLAILTLLTLAAFINVAITVVIAPMLVKIFTGYESIFTQRGADILAVQLPIILALTWVCIDPLLQAVYTVRAFRIEGLTSGEDLLVRLKRIAPLIALIAFGASSLSAAPAATVSREELNHSIDRTLQAHDYDWRNPPATDSEKKDWFLDAVDRAVAYIEKGWKALGDLWSDFLDWIGRMLRPVMPYADPSQAGKPKAVRPIFYVFAAAVLLIMLTLLWKFRPRKKEPTPIAGSATRAIDLNNEGLLASDLPEDEWMKMADRYASSGDLRLALRALYLGTLALLTHRGFLTIHACKSNRDYERELRRRARDAGLSQIFGVNVRSFEQSWYGFHEVTAEQIQDFRDNLGRMRANAA